jgi:hypothetical protein
MASPDGRTVGLAVPENISVDGARLLASTAVPPGSALLLESDCHLSEAVVGLDDGPPLTFQVGRCASLEGGGHLLAGTFGRRLTGEELAGLAGPASL